jgi:hypothetical protein
VTNRRPTADGPLVSVSELVKVYDLGEQQVHALRGITLDIGAGAARKSPRHSRTQAQ